MKYFVVGMVFLLLMPSVILLAEEKQPVPFNREYRFLLGSPQELALIAANGQTLNKVFQDVYYRGFGRNIQGKIQPWIDGIWYVYWTYFWSIWPHEFGHKARANQLGGDFIIEGFSFPFPRARMELPAEIAKGKNGLSTVGGFEVNNLMLQQIRQDFYMNDYARADELVHAFIQEVYYPFYTLLVAPARVKKAQTWTDTRGDPVEYILTVYQGYYNRPAIREDGSVDPDLVRLYRESFYLNILWTLLDPMLYRNAKAFSVDLRKDDPIMRPKMFGKREFTWIWGTLFNASPLGYELYLQNYFRFNDILIATYIRGGRPYKNHGLGMYIPNLIGRQKIGIGIGADYWNQGIYGRGLALTLDGRIRFSQRFALLLQGGWKQRGYLIGRRIEESSLLLGGIRYCF